MSYIPPSLVLSPKASISDLRVLHDGGAGNWALASMKWNGDPAYGMRWNGSSHKEGSIVGNPQSRGIPTWFILPDGIGEVIEERLKKDGLLQDDSDVKK